MSTASVGMPQSSSSLTNCSSTILVFSAFLMVSLLPMYTAPIICSAGISSGKLKGLITTTGP
jgi:hypothetical protein